MKKLILRDITYLVYCVYMEKDPNLCQTLKDWVTFVKDAQNEHFGDCIGECNSCIRCQYEEILIKATQIRNYLKMEKFIQ